MSTPARFLFRANASGLAGHFRRPNNAFLKVQASCSLPVVGGKAESAVEWDDFTKSEDYSGLGDLKDFVTFKKVTSAANGDFKNRAAAKAMTSGNAEEGDIPTETTAEAYAAGLKFGKWLEIGEVSAKLIGEQPDRGKQPFIRPRHSKINGVMVEGHELDIRVNEKPFSSKPTMADLCSAYEGDDDFFKEHRCHFLPTGLPVRSSKTRKTPQARGIVLCTIVKRIKWKGEPHPTAKIHGHMVEIPGLGRIYFGEMLISDLSRRLTMVRAKLGSDIGGEGAAVEVETNGVTWP